MKHDLTGPPPPPGVEDRRKGTIIGTCFVCGAKDVSSNEECFGPPPSIFANNFADARIEPATLETVAAEMRERIRNPQPRKLREEQTLPMHPDDAAKIEAWERDHVIGCSKCQTPWIDMQSRCGCGAPPAYVRRQRPGT